MSSDRLILGDEQFKNYLPLLEKKRVALFSNHSGIVGDKIILADGKVQHGGFLSAEGQDATLIPFGKDGQGRTVRYGEHILDALLSKGVDVVTIFCPEHGFRGTEDAGASVANGVDEKSGIPILSLFGSASSFLSDEEIMNTFDTLVVDIQDVGLRYYTYHITIFYLMDACARSGKNLIILDRPNPNGFYVDGEILHEDCRSGIGKLPVPTVHGMTLGELALMINGEGWLKAGKNACNLTVIPMKNYNHQVKYALVRAPSPNIKNMRAVYLYASTCFFENTCVSVGRGTDFPFEAYGSPFFAGISNYDFSFVPESMTGASNPSFLGEACFGKDLRGLAIEDVWSRQINLSYLVDSYHNCPKEIKSDFWGMPDENGLFWIDKLSGSAGAGSLRNLIIAGKSESEIKALWQDDIKRFKKERAAYLLYSE